MQLAVMPLLAGSHTRSQQRPVSLTRVARMPVNRTLAVTEPLPYALSHPSQVGVSPLYRAGNGGAARSNAPAKMTQRVREVWV